MQAHGPSSRICTYIYTFLLLLFFFFLGSQPIFNKSPLRTTLFFFLTCESMSDLKAAQRPQTTRLQYSPKTTLGSAIYPKKSTLVTIYQKKKKTVQILIIKPKSLQPLSTLNAKKVQKKIKLLSIEKESAYTGMCMDWVESIF